MVGITCEKTEIPVACFYEWGFMWAEYEAGIGRIPDIIRRNPLQAVTRNHMRRNGFHRML